MKSNILILIFILAGISSFAQISSWAWASANTGYGSNYSATNNSATDAAGNVYVTGTFSSATIQIGSITLTRNDSNEVDNVFLAKYDPNGHVQWARVAGGDHNAMTKGISVDPNGNVVIGGTFFGDSLNFGGTALRQKHRNVIISSSDWFVAKYDPSGNLIWTKTQDTSSNGLIYLNNLTTDQAGNIYICGGAFIQSDTVYVGGNAVLDGGLGNIDAIVAKVDANGNMLWARHAGNTGTQDESYGIATDNGGNCYITGIFQSTAAHFGPVLLVGSNGNAHPFTAKYDASGNVSWAVSANTNGVGYGTVATMDRNNHLYVGAIMDGDSVSFGSYTVYASDISNNNNMALVQYDTAGNVLWASSAGDAGSDQPTSIAIDTAGHVLMAGYFNGTRFISGSDTALSVGMDDIFIEAFSASGAPLWLQTMGGTGRDVGSISADAQGDIILTGQFSSPEFDLSGYSFLNNDTPYYHSFVARSGISPLGISQLSATESISAYPNPTHGTITVALPQGASSITVVDMLGQVMQSQNLQGQTTVNISLSQPGVYFVQVKSGSQTATRRVVVD